MLISVSRCSRACASTLHPRLAHAPTPSPPLPQIWDLVANKQLSELSGHTHAVTGLHFHPVEYLLGTCSADKTIKVGTGGQGPLALSSWAVMTASGCRTLISNH
jgi:hypothetical protein